MATVRIQLNPYAAIPDDTVANAARHRVNSGTNFPIHCMAFDAATDQMAYWQFIADSYGSGNLTLDIYWYADTATSGDVIWGAQVSVITANTDSQDIETDAFATANTVTDSHLGTTGQRLHQASITISNLDSLASGDHVVLKLYRDADAGGDTMTGDAFVTMVELSYSDT